MRVLRIGFTAEAFMSSLGLGFQIFRSLGIRVRSCFVCRAAHGFELFPCCFYVSEVGATCTSKSLAVFCWQLGTILSKILAQSSRVFFWAKVSLAAARRVTFEATSTLPRLPTLSWPASCRSKLQIKELEWTAQAVRDLKLLRTSVGIPSVDRRRS